MSCLQVHEFFFREQFSFGFTVVGVIDAAIDRTNGSALRFIVKTYTFGAFIGYDVIHIHAYGFVFKVGIGGFPTQQLHCTAQAGTIGKAPFSAPFINCVIRTFRLTCTAVDAFVGNHNRHI